MTLYRSESGAEHFGEFQLEREIGRGATATVYLARLPLAKACFSLKIFHPRLFQAPSIALRIQREFELLQSLRHPNIVPVHQLLPTDPPALVMEYIDGENLEVFQGRLPYVLPEVSVLIVIEILKALECAHGEGIIHRDLKPENVLIRKDGAIFVADFGLARIINSTSAITQTNHIVGSVDYMAPEQTLGEALAATSDLFSVGAVLYFLITGTRPFTRSTSVATLQAIKEANIEGPEKRNPKVSAELSRLLQTAMALDPAARFQTAKAFREALQNYLHGVGLTNEVFDFRSWIKDSTRGTMEALALAADGLTLQAEAALQANDSNRILERLAHLSLKAPESPAIGKMTKAMDSLRSKQTHRYYFFAASLLLIVLALGFAYDRFRPVQQAASLSSPLPMGAIIPPVLVGDVHFTLGPGIDVLWDGKRIDPTGPLLAQPVGKHKLVLKRKGFDPIRSEVQVSEKEPLKINVK